MENNKEKVFVQGLRVFRPRSGAPEWVKLNFLVKTDELIKWLQENSQNNEVRFDMKKSKGDKLYLELNQYKPIPKGEKPRISQNFANNEALKDGQDSKLDKANADMAGEELPPENPF